MLRSILCLVERINYIRIDPLVIHSSRPRYKYSDRTSYRNQRRGRVSLILSLDDTRFWNPGDRRPVQSFRGSLDSVNYALCMNSTSGFVVESRKRISISGEIRSARIQNYHDYNIVILVRIN